MSIYRINIEEKKEEIKMSDKYVYVFDYSQFDYGKKPCPFCKIPLKQRIDYFTCSENKKYYSGILFWKKYCKIEGVHDHFICPECEMHWIVKLNDHSGFNKIKVG